MVDPGRRELTNKGKPGVRDKDGEDNSDFVDEDGLQSLGSTVRDTHGSKDRSREGHGWHNGIYNWREHDGQGEPEIVPFRSNRSESV